MPRLSKCKDEEKWQEIVKKAKLFLQKILK
jgi:hypothetical protein